ncbi:glycosyltransferase family 1 protein [Rhodanobacter sp. KK11]|uniref:glycosyltransferase family 4 protein n=1 Tax=Rhodanobacter sp. KK11 TaxID=3083255 RepID=UPI002966AD6C|nr:glycosyltransferase family 1 protein [Rhodanobacter sp. KK11]MDW2980347.1 glycosyltransferase family 1 protein [Rhodanobacter sp. KK11]
MKVLLIGNYENLRQQSMQRFAVMLRDGLAAAGHQVRLVRPPVWLGRLRRGEMGLAKWIGYLDRFLLYPPLLRRQLHWADVVHICDHANAVYVPHLGGKPHVVTCHDMLAIRAALGEIPESPTGWSGRIYQRWILRSLRKAQAVACVSMQTAKELQRVAGLSEDRLTVVPNALNYPYRSMPAAEVKPYLDALGLEPNQAFFLHVGGNQWYKNRPGVLRLFAELVQHPAYRSHRLVMAGKPWTEEMRLLVASLKLDGRVVERVEVSNEQLRALYSSAEALLFPSLQEGFGWPVVEAQACGCPVVTTNRPPMNDVGGPAAIYIDPANPVDAAGKIASDLAECERWRRKGLENAVRFSMSAMLKGYLKLYRHAGQTVAATQPVFEDEA